MNLSSLVGAAHNHYGKDCDRELYGSGGGEIDAGDIVKLPKNIYTYPSSIRGRVGRITSVNTYFSQCGDCRIRLNDGRLIRADTADLDLIKKAKKIPKSRRVWDYKKKNLSNPI
jgi:hypothetical protein